MLDAALEFVKTLAAKNKTILFVGTKPEAKEAVMSMAESLGMPYVTERWIGGTLSNFSEIKKRITELENYRKDSISGGLDKYTKKERVVMAKKMEKLSRYYSGLVGVKKTPDAVFIVDTKKEHIALAECRTSNVPVIALLNSDSNMKGIDYPILANDAGTMSIKFFTNAITAAYKSTEGTQNVMLATKVESVEEAFKVCGKPAAFEHKYDGFRIIISYDGKKIKLFTRRLEDVTNQFPDVVEIVSNYVKANSTNPRSA
jgi:small subunit ribosomal protein S2